MNIAGYVRCLDASLEQSVHHSRKLSSGRALVRLERAVRIAVDKADGICRCDGAVSPVVHAYVRERYGYRSSARAADGSHQCCQLCPCDGLVRLKGTVRIAVYNAQVAHCGDSQAVPVAVVDISKAHVVSRI